jgi:nitrogen regulatory protein PII
MKLVVALGRPERLGYIKRALREVNVEQLTVRRRGPHPDTRFYMAPRPRAEITASDDNAERVFNAARRAAMPDGAISSGNARVFMVSLEEHDEPQLDEPKTSGERVI